VSKRRDPEEVARRQREDSFGAFRRETEPAMRRIAYARANPARHRVDPQVAVDEAYEQFERDHFDRVPEDERRARLAMIVTRRAIDLVRRPKYASELPEGDRDGHIAAPDDQFERVDGALDAQAALLPALPVLDALNDKQRTALLRLTVDGDDVSNVATDMELSERRIRQLRDEALVRLRRKYGLQPKGVPVSRAAGDATEDDAEGEK
jgi:DNA-directed RNA polymerase specialized sigma24 family protein